VRDHGAEFRIDLQRRLTTGAVHLKKWAGHAAIISLNHE
jgi:hypothetical protein